MKNRKLNWQRCKCGCLGNTLSIANLNYWYNGRMLYEGHGNLFSKQINYFRTNKDMDEAVIRHAIPRLNILREEIDKALIKLNNISDLPNTRSSSGNQFVQPTGC